MDYIFELSPSNDSLLQYPQTESDLPILTDIDESLLALTESNESASYDSFQSHYNVTSNTPKQYHSFESCLPIPMDNEALSIYPIPENVYLPSNYDDQFSHPLPNPLTSTLNNPFNLLGGQVEAALPPPPVSPIRAGTSTSSATTPYSWVDFDPIHQNSGDTGQDRQLQPLSSALDMGDVDFPWLAKSSESNENYEIIQEEGPLMQLLSPVFNMGSMPFPWLPNNLESNDKQDPLTAFPFYPVPISEVKVVAPGPTRRRCSSAVKRSGAYVCEVCGKSYMHYQILKNHMRLHTDGVVNASGSYVCKVCDKSFKEYNHLTNHSRIHTLAKRSTCSRCDKFFTLPRDKIVHMVTEVCIRADRYLRRIGEGWSCTCCNAGPFESRDKAVRHTRKHETGKGLSCPVCSTGYQGQKVGVLVKHVRDCHAEYIASLNM